MSGQFSHPSVAQMQAAQQKAKYDVQIMHAVAMQATAAACRIGNLRSVKSYAPTVTETVKEGYLVIERIAFWREFPLVGWFMSNRLADQLDRLTDWLDTAVQPDTTNSN